MRKSKLTMIALSIGMSSLFISNANAADLVAESAAPRVSMVDTDDTGSTYTYDWDMWSQTDDPGGTDQSSYWILDDRDNSYPMMVESYIYDGVHDYSDGAFYIDSYGNTLLGWNFETNNYGVAVTLDSYVSLGSGTVFVDPTNGKVGIRNFTPEAVLDVAGDIKASFENSDDKNNHNLMALKVNNTGTGNSDVGFSMENNETGFKWTFRTYDPVEGFAASKIGTGGTEFEVGNTGTTLETTVVKMGGVVVFKDGHLVNKSGNELTSLVQEQNIKLASMESTLNSKDAKIAQLELKMQAMQTRVAMMETIFTNLALATSNKTEKVSLNK